ncbi:hypothetical protein [Dyella subtropica]|uniref:hypothetical protein n=1 Tax=Dyella subtropica TaxID=2992127 RepID=UPI0022583242|nr:hypothetical protein [Dyella subtropica]
MRTRDSIVITLFLLLLGLAWVAVLASLPWWAGVPSAMAMEAAALGLPRLKARRVVSWLVFYGMLGLAGLAVSLARAMGGGAGAWFVAVLLALLGFLLKAWVETRYGLLNEAPNAPADAQAVPAAPNTAPGKTPHLRSLQWQDVPAWGGVEDRAARLASKRPCYLVNGEIRFGPPTGDFLLSGGLVVIGWAGASYAESPDGRWFLASRPENHPGCCDYLHDHLERRLYALPSWHVRGWSAEGPWLSQGREGVSYPLHQVATPEQTDDYLPLRDLWLPRRFVESLPLSRQTAHPPAGPHIATLDMRLPDAFAALFDPLESLHRPQFRLAVNGADSGLLVYGLHDAWDAAGQTLRVHAWQVDAAPTSIAAWHWTRLTGWQSIPS